jgi:RNase P subunit RPR2
MSDIEDNARSLTWWWEQLNLSEDWNSLTRGMRKDLLKKLQRTFIDVAEFHVSQDEILDLIRLTDPPTVWDAMLALRGLPDKKNKSHRQILAYLSKVVINTWKQQHPIDESTWQPSPKPEKRRKLASLKTIEKWDSTNFKRTHCDGCGKLLYDGEISLCKTCQRQRNGKDIEH